MYHCAGLSCFSTIRGSITHCGFKIFDSIYFDPCLFINNWLVRNKYINLRNTLQIISFFSLVMLRWSNYYCTNLVKCFNTLIFKGLLKVEIWLWLFIVTLNSEAEGCIIFKMSYLLKESVKSWSIFFKTEQIVSFSFSWRFILPTKMA